MSSKSGSGAGGRSLPSDETRVLNQAVQFVRFGYAWEKELTGSQQLRSLTLYPPSQSRNGQWLAVGKSWGVDGKWVCFYRSPDPLGALVGMVTKIWNGSIEWKRDTWAETHDPLSPAS